MKTKFEEYLERAETIKAYLSRQILAASPRSSCVHYHELFFDDWSMIP